MTKVLFVVPELVHDHLAAQLLQLLTTLPRGDFDCRVCVLGKSATPATTIRQLRFEVDAPGRGRLFDFSSLNHLRWLTRWYEPDVVHVWGHPTLRAMLVAGFKGKLVVSPCLTPAVRRSWWRWLDSRQLRKAKHVVAFGQVEAERCRNLGARPEQIVVVQPAVRVEQNQAAASTDIPARYVLCVGRLLSQKGFMEAIWSLDILRYVHPDLHLVIVGEGPDRPRLEHFTSALEATRSVQFLGEVADVYPLMQRAEIVWSPGRAETGTQVILEAMALGKPIIASHFPRIAELIADGVTGFLVPPEDKAQLARQTQRLLTEPDLRTQLGEAARRRAEDRHQPAALTQTLARLYCD